MSEELVPISALQHYLYCPRQCALIHVEQTFDENVFTLRGRRVHERADEPTHEVVDGVRVERALPLFAESLGLVGRADVVEFRDGVPFPIEYKSGKRGRKRADQVQLCAQGMCLEEMFDVRVESGSLYYDRSRRRLEVRFDAELRSLVNDTIEAVRALSLQEKLPAPVNDNRCPTCSLIDACMPNTISRFKPQALFEVADK